MIGFHEAAKCLAIKKVSVMYQIFPSFKFLFMTSGGDISQFELKCFNHSILSTEELYHCMYSYDIHEEIILPFIRNECVTCFHASTLSLLCLSLNAVSKGGMLLYTVAPRYNVPRYYADSDIKRSVVDPDFLPPGVKWLGCHQSCFAGVSFSQATC